ADGGRWRLGSREFEWREWKGHTASDLVLVDRTSGVVFAGGLVFADRVPTTPHAQVGDWLQSLATFAPAPGATVVPSHGPVHADGRGAAQTRAYLQWLDRQFTDWAAQGLDMNEVLRAPVPADFRRWAAFDTEYLRNVAHLYPRYEQRAFGAAVKRR
ncbi:MAG: MBL fold metallo-hydrolase, partial [Rubrivivax sp.]|nr:MBL fold metallo-hydrolase [Rubrivivax sp.]